MVDMCVARLSAGFYTPLGACRRWVRPGQADAALVQFPTSRMKNKYILVRAGESQAEAAGYVLTNPVAKTSMDSGLSQLGKRQVGCHCCLMPVLPQTRRNPARPQDASREVHRHRIWNAKQQLSAVNAADGRRYVFPTGAQVVKGTLPAIRAAEGFDWDSEDIYLWPSITQRAYQTAEILGSQLGVSRNRIVPGVAFFKLFYQCRALSCIYLLPSITQRPFQTAKILDKQLGVSLNCIVPGASLRLRFRLAVSHWNAFCLHSGCCEEASPFVLCFCATT